MASHLATWRIPLALVFATACIVGGYFLAVTSLHPPLASATSEAELLAAIAMKDSDGDGLPDWEESLYGTDPRMSDSRSLGMTDGEAVEKGLIVPRAIADVPAPPSGGTGQSADEMGLPSPAEGSLTDVFAKNFFSTYVAARQNAGRDLTQEETAAIAAKALEQLSGSVKVSPDFRTASQLTIAGRGADALRAYAAAAEGVFAAHTTNYPKSELEYLADAIANDTEALAKITLIATAYREIATGLAVLAVPEEVASTHLSLVNTLAQMGNISGDFARYDSDPVVTMLALAQYKDAVLALANTFVGIATTFREGQVTLTPGTPGASFVNVVANHQAKAAP